ncbi:hypothetical protein COLO4_12268 [Corchorus olitorius]|uniref:Myb/SANT-like domain-containing protein n=1 Tax=Corchorus olitorius TaxID=93759 RepID=A0A1R3K1G2_9ROSI|nr:hypothetical protein COLO4_12268 [Corchorus olitorius]
MDVVVSPRHERHVRINWTVEEEGILLDCVLTVMNGNQVLACWDYIRVEQLFNQRCPGKNPGMVAIKSKLKVLKRDFNQAREMLGYGFSFNDETKMIEGPEELWEAWLQQFHFATSLKGKPFPQFMCYKSCLTQNGVKLLEMSLVAWIKSIGFILMIV